MDTLQAKYALILQVDHPVNIKSVENVIELMKEAGIQINSPVNCEDQAIMEIQDNEGTCKMFVVEDTKNQNPITLIEKIDSTFQNLTELSSTVDLSTFRFGLLH